MKQTFYIPIQIFRESIENLPRETKRTKMKLLFFLLPLIEGSLGQLSVADVNIPPINVVQNVTKVVDEVYCLFGYVYKFVDEDLTDLPDLDQGMKQTNFYIWLRSLGQSNEAYEETYGNETQVTPMNVTRNVVQIFVFFHDIGSNGKDDWILDFTNHSMTRPSFEYLIMISINYANFVINKDQAVKNIEPIAHNSATFLEWAWKKFATSNTYKYITFFGHGIGAFIASRTAERIVLKLDSSREFMSELTALDPEPPIGETELQSLPSCYRYSTTINKTVAQGVIVIHTSSCSRSPLIQACNSSSNVTLGAIDFYPNGGREQPGCPKSDLSCSRKRATSLLCGALRQPISYLSSFPCSNFDSFKAGNCSSSCSWIGCPMMNGFYQLGTGRFYLCTNAQPPYGRGWNPSAPGYCPAPIEV